MPTFCEDLMTPTSPIYQFEDGPINALYVNIARNPDIKITQ
jgi:hypothetical protein